jgi:hypothetical protein
MKRSAVAVLLAAVLSVGTVACGTPSVVLAPSRETFTARDYERIYARWTRDADEFSFGRLDDVLNASATFESVEFRRAYVVRYAADFSLTTEARDEMIRAQEAEAAAAHEFFVTLAGKRFRESDLTNERSAWRVLLVSADGAQFVPIEIARVRRPTPAEAKYFASVSPFRQSFRITFPAQRPDGSPVFSSRSPYALLRFTGPQGTVDLKWRFKAP